MIKLIKIKLTLALCGTLILCGCASIITGNNQSVSVSTRPVQGASCKLTNDKGTWYVTTPGSVVVNRAYGDLTVICNKDNLTGILPVKSTTKGMAFGNILAGGIIGGAIDCGTGSAYDYPTHIEVPLA